MAPNALQSKFEIQHKYVIRNTHFIIVDSVSVCCVRIIFFSVVFITSHLTVAQRPGIFLGLWQLV